jgi:hypothetical protein
MRRLRFIARLERPSQQCRDRAGQSTFVSLEASRPGQICPCEGAVLLAWEHAVTSHSISLPTPHRPRPHAVTGATPPRQCRGRTWAVEVRRLSFVGVCDDDTARPVKRRGVMVVVTLCYPTCQAATADLYRNAFRACGLLPWNRQQDLKSLPVKPWARRPDRQARIVSSTSAAGERTTAQPREALRRDTPGTTCYSVWLRAIIA